MAASNRPKRVIVVDADNPLAEVRGEFFWREDHEALVAAAREEAYRAGYQSGWADAAHRVPPPATPHVVEIVRRRSVMAWLRRAVVGLVLLAMLVIVLATVSEQLAAAR